MTAYECDFCEAEIASDADGMILEEDIAEVYNPAWPDDHDPVTVLMHYECIPDGWRTG